MSSGGGGSMPTQTTNTVQKSDPWSGQMPFLSNSGSGAASNGKPSAGVFNEAATLYQNPLQYFPGQTFAPPSAETNQAIAAQTQRATNGSPVTGAMDSTLLGTLRGDYLDPASNPGYQTMVDRTIAGVRPGIDSSFEGAGRYGGGLAARAQGQGVADAVGALNYGNYNDERTRQMQGMLFAPAAANQDYYDIAKLGEAGAQKEGIQQQAIDDQVSRFNFGQMEPWQRLGMYNQMIQGNYGGTTSGTQTASGTPGRGSIGSGLLGGGLAGAGLGSMIGGPFGAAIGGVGGGLLGLLGR